MPAAECSTLPWEKNWSRSPKIIILSGDIEELGEMLRAVRSGRSVTRPHIQGHPAASPPLPGPPCARCGGGGRTDGARRSHKVGQTGPCARMERFELTRFPLSHLSANIDYRDTTIGRSGEKVYPPPPQKKFAAGQRSRGRHCLRSDCGPCGGGGGSGVCSHQIRSERVSGRGET